MFYLGNLIYREGDLANVIFIIISGEIEVI
jgi:CRP-like cAMP-binding protein